MLPIMHLTYHHVTHNALYISSHVTLNALYASSHVTQNAVYVSSQVTHNALYLTAGQLKLQTHPTGPSSSNLQTPP
jgi:hypothetical protein